MRRGSPREARGELALVLTTVRLWLSGAVGKHAVESGLCEEAAVPWRRGSSGVAHRRREGWTSSGRELVRRVAEASAGWAGRGKVRRELAGVVHAGSCTEERRPWPCRSSAARAAMRREKGSCDWASGGGSRREWEKRVRVGLSKEREEERAGSFFFFFERE